MAELKKGSNRTRYDLLLPADLPGLSKEAIDAINRRFSQVAEGLAANAGHMGTVKLMADLDLNGFRLKNLGDPLVSTDAANAATASAAAFSTARLLAEGGDDLGIDVGDTDEGGDLVDDRPAPVVRDINLEWTNAKKGHRAKWKRPKHSTSKLKGYYVVFFNSTNFLETTDGTVAASEAAAERFTTENRYTAHLNRLNYDAAFSTGVDVKITPVTMMHGAEVRGTPATFGSLVALGLDFVTPTDAVNVVDVGVNANAPQQMLLNGDFLFNDGAGICNGWKRFLITPGADQTITNVNTNTVFWDEPNHALVWQDEDGRISHPMKKRLKKSQFYSMQFLAKTDGSFGSGTAFIVFVDSGDLTTSTSFTINLADLTDSYQPFGGRLESSSTYDFTTSNMFLTIRTLGPLTTTNNIIIDAVMLVRGKTPFAFTPRSEAYEGDTTNPGTAENITLAAMNDVAAPDLGNPSDLQGGFDFDGGRIEYGTYA